MCAGHTALPRSLHFELPESELDDVQYRGGFADVLRCEYGGRGVAVKILRRRGLSSQEMRKVSQLWRDSLPVSIGELSVRVVEVL